MINKVVLFSCLSLALQLDICHSSPGQNGNVIIDYSTNIIIKNGKRIEEKSYYIQVNSKSADWISDVSIPYNENNDLDILEAEVVDLDGNVLRKLKKKEIITRSHISRISFFEDDYVKTFKLKWHKFPYRIRYSYRITSKQYMSVARWSPVINTDIFTMRSTLNVSVPADYPVQVKTHGVLGFSVDTLDSEISLSWKAEGIKPMRTEPYTPPLEELVPFVFVVPEKFEYGQEGSFSSWADYGLWQSKMNEGLDELPPSEQQRVDRLLQGITDTRAKISRLYQYMQDNTRYINVSIDVGGLQPYPASYVAENKYGDCKALTIYMKALLKYAGIDSYYTKVYAGENPWRLDASLPSQQFNHVILCVPNEGDTIWLENTASYLPAGYLGTFTQNRKGFLINGKDSQLVQTPSLKERDVAEHSTYVLDIGEDEEIPVNVSKKLRGDAFETLRYYQIERSEEDQKKWVERNIPFKALDVKDWSFDYPDRDAREVGVAVKLVSRESVRDIAGSKVISVPQLTLVDLEKPEEHDFPVRINYPVRKVDSIIFKIPSLGKYEPKIPEEVNLDSSFGQYKLRSYIENDRVILVRDYRLISGTFPKEDYKYLYDYFESINNYQRELLIVLKPKS